MIEKIVITIPRDVIGSRDHRMVAIINGIVKAAVHLDRKKQANKHACRKAKGKRQWD